MTGDISEEEEESSESDEEEEGDTLVECPSCDNEALHDILRENPKGEGFDYLLKCLECGNIHRFELRPPKGVTIPLRLSEGPESINGELEIDVDEELKNGDEFEYDEKVWKITRLDGEDETILPSSLAESVVCIWAVRSDQVRLKLTLSDRDISDSTVIEVPAEEEFSGGDIVWIDDEEWVVRAIHTGEGRTFKGPVEAGKIKRLFLHPPKKPEKPQRRWRRFT